MSEKRIESSFDDYITSEQVALRNLINSDFNFPDTRQFGPANYTKMHSEHRLGRFRSPDARKLATSDWDVISEFTSKGKSIPSFLEAGPREFLYHSPHSVRAVIVTTGGLAPGLNCGRYPRCLDDRHALSRQDPKQAYW